MATAELVSDPALESAAFADLESLDDMLDDAAADHAELDFSDELDAQLDGADFASDEDVLDEELLADEDALAGSWDDGFEDGALLDGDSLDELLDEFSPTASLSAPATAGAATGLIRQIEPIVLDQLAADDADAFLRGIRRRLAGVAARAAPLLQRAMPAVQGVLGRLGPWGMAASAGLGAIRGVAQGQGLRGALRGAAGGLTAGIPGVGAVLSRLGGAGGLLRGVAAAAGGGGGNASSVVRNVLGTLAPSGGAGAGLAGMLGGVLQGDAADDDAALDALADEADARRMPAGVVLPIGAGLAIRVVAQHGSRVSAQPAARRSATWTAARAGERTLLNAGLRVPGTAGRRIRVMRAIARLASELLRSRGGEPRELPAAVSTAANRILAVTQRAPTVGQVPRAVARRKVAARQRILNRMPVSALQRAPIRRSAAA